MWGHVGQDHWQRACLAKLTDAPALTQLYEVQAIRNSGLN
jgi:hypothetical protein